MAEFEGIWAVFSITKRAQSNLFIFFLIVFYILKAKLKEILNKKLNVGCLVLESLNII